MLRDVRNEDILEIVRAAPRRYKGMFRINLEKAVPLKCFGRAEEIANAVLFFASDQSGFVTGQVLSFSGGLTMVLGGELR